MSYLSGKVIWITGASGCIGEALVYELAEKGAMLILSARRKNELERVKAKLSFEGPSQHCNASTGPFKINHTSDRRTTSDSMLRTH
jgi:NADP-dependent 3-hydroxy acid dehydrogenase YdfG